MSIYAEIVEGIVVNTIVADANFVASQTNKNYVLCNRGGIGWSFDGTNFIAPQPFASWTLDENYDWQPPTPQPPHLPDGDDRRWYWSEEELVWVAI
jgi:hypothetical protein